MLNMFGTDKFYDVVKYSFAIYAAKRVHITDSKIIPIIDAGHGGLNDMGKYVTAPHKMAEHKDLKFYEGVWNRAIAARFMIEQEQSGRSYIFISSPVEDTPLRERVRMVVNATSYANKLGKKPYVVCLHANAYGLESVNGVEVYTSPGATDADPIAAIQYDELEKLGWRMRPGSGQGEVDKEERFTMLVEPEKFGVPSTLPEIGFYTNYEQVLEMCLPETMETIGQLLRNADLRVEHEGIL